MLFSNMSNSCWKWLQIDNIIFLVVLFNSGYSSFLGYIFLYTKIPFIIHTLDFLVIYRCVDYIGLSYKENPYLFKREKFLHHKSYFKYTGFSCQSPYFCCTRGYLVHIPLKIYGLKVVKNLLFYFSETCKWNNSQM